MKVIKTPTQMMAKGYWLDAAGGLTWGVPAYGAIQLEQSEYLALHATMPCERHAAKLAAAVVVAEAAAAAVASV